MEIIKLTDIMLALIHQVSKATPEDGLETDVTTFITRPMWNMWCLATNVPLDSVPNKTMRVYGSRTIIIESDALWLISVPNSLIYDKHD